MALSVHPPLYSLNLAILQMKRVLAMDDLDTTPGIEVWTSALQRMLG